MITTPTKENDSIASTDATRPTAKKPRLEARWVNENGKLICKWLSYENEKR